MRSGLTVLLIVLFAAFGAVFGALNGDPVTVDLYFTQATLPKGAALLTALVLGWLSGGCLVWFARGRRDRRRARAAAARPQPAASAGGDDAAVSGGA